MIIFLIYDMSSSSALYVMSRLNAIIGCILLCINRPLHWSIVGHTTPAYNDASPFFTQLIQLRQHFVACNLDGYCSTYNRCR